MPSLFSRLKSKDGSQKKSKKGANYDDTDLSPVKPKWDDAYTRTTVEPEEIQDLMRRCTEELKARALDHPFLLLPFRPTSDPSAVRTFIRHFFDGSQPLRGEFLSQELRMTEPMVIAGVVKWCWSRLSGGVVGWDAYELFKVGEHDSNMARDSFKTFIPLSVESRARSSIIFYFFDLLSAIAAHGKMNGMGGRKLSRMGAWWAFEQKDTGSGFEGGYKAWASAADATSHLFFAYLRSLAPQKQTQGAISLLPISLLKLLQETEYPPRTPSLMQSSTYKVVMIVDTVSPTPFALLRRANHFQYREEDRILREFSEYEDPVTALTEECRRVLKAVSSANQSQVSSAKHSTGLRDASWSRFEDIGFASALEDECEDDEATAARKPQGLKTAPASGNIGRGRPTTPSWADFLSSGFVDENPHSPNVLLPPDKVLPPIETDARQRSSQSHSPRLESNRLEPGELASIARFDLDDSFWWVWMSSLAPEETPERKSAFGRCAVIETAIKCGRWLVMEEMVVGAAPEPQEGTYIAEKKGFFSWTKRSKGVIRRRSTGKQPLEKGSATADSTALSKPSIGPDQQARIQAAAAQLQARQQQEQQQKTLQARRGRNDEWARERTTSVLTLQSDIMRQASPAMKWANKYDKEAIRETYLTNNAAGRGLGVSTMQRHESNGHDDYSNDHHLDEPEFRPEVPEKPQLQLYPSPLAMNSPSKLPSPPSHSPVNRQDDEPRAHPGKATAGLSGLRPAKLFENGRRSPLPPPKDSYEDGRENMPTPEPDTSPRDKKSKKLHKEKGGGGGFRKLFGRNKNRISKLPEDAAEDVNGMLQRETGTPEPPKPAAPLPVPQPVASEFNVPTPVQEEAYTTPMEPPQPVTVETQAHEPQHEPSGDGFISDDDADEAPVETPRFDQGPLQEQPAFVPDDEYEDAVPPPIARHAKTPDPPTKVSPTPSDEGSRPPPALDRWAQIRKNAADRAAQRQTEEQSRGGYNRTTEGDGDTSGEETIETRVARIKARVAELTGTMETSQGPPLTMAPAAAVRR